MPTLHLSRPASRGHVGTTLTPITRRVSGPWLWLAGGVLLFFAVPFVGTDVLGLQPDLYHLIYFTTAVAWCAAFLLRYQHELRDLWRSNLTWSLAVGALAGIGVVAIVLGQEATNHPEGWRWWFEIGWRGVVYGSVDTLVLFVFPAAVAYLLMHGKRSGTKRRIGYAGLALALSLLMSTSYHLGYPEYRDADMRSPLIGTVIASSATVVTGNPLGAFLTHGPAHVAAAVHQSEGGPTKMLPPQETSDYPSHGDQDVAAGLAGLWLLGTAGALSLLVRRRRRADTGR